MSPSTPAWQQFEELVRRILEAKGFSVAAHSPRGDAGFDFIGVLGTERWAIEVKYYRTTRAQRGLIEAAAIRVINRGSTAQVSRGMLIVSCAVPAAVRSALENRFSIVVADRFDLREWATDTPQLADELDALIESDPTSPPESFAHRSDLRERVKPLQPLRMRREDTRGSELCTKLKGVKRGKEEWAKYEELCAEILKYLFPNDLYGWEKQKRTDDGLNRFDFVCRVRPTTEFWRFLIDHLDSRYVLFEFKNYSGRIKQGQILTTEKYLLERGLRRVAIILTRVGAEPGAIAMAQGAMREHGKLMLIVNDDTLCKMLHMKEGGEDPTDCLFELADDFLLSLPR